MGAEYVTTTNHDEIRAWAQKRGGKPATLRAASDAQQSALEIFFPDYGGRENVEEISWKEFFSVLDEQNLVFVHQETTATGEISRYNAVVPAAVAQEMAGSQNAEPHDKLVM